MRTPEHIDIRPAIGLWAPGEYFNHCKRCNLIFVGDKRALSCADCAYRDEDIRAKAFAAGRAQGLALACDIMQNQFQGTKEPTLRPYMNAFHRAWTAILDAKEGK